MTLIDGTGATLSPPSLTTDSITADLCPGCVAAVVIDAGRIELAHEATCPADTAEGGRRA